jgi:hypothetical protein
MIYTLKPNFYNQKNSYLLYSNFSKQKEFIKEILGDKYDSILNKKKYKDHPARKSLEICDLMIDQGGVIKWPENEDKINQILEVVLMNFIINKCSSRTKNDFILGNFGNYRNPDIIKRNKSRVLSNEDYLSLMTEFACAARYLNKHNYSIEAIPERETSSPDFKLIISSPPSVILFECKRLMNHCDKIIIQSKIKQSNKQIKEFSEIKKLESCGVLVLDISGICPCLQVELDQHLNKIPQKIENVKNDIESLLKNDYKSVSGVLILWNEYEHFQKNNLSLFVFHKRGILVEHKKPKYSISPDTIETKDWGYSFYLPVYWKSRKN